MIRIIKYLLFFTLVPVVFICCRKEGAWCFQGAGEVIMEERPGGNIRIIEILDDPDVVLTQVQGSGTVSVEAGENLVDGIITEITGDRLLIRNNNTCNWVRSFDVPVRIHVGVMKLDSIIFRGSGRLSSSNHLVNDSIQIDVREGAGSIDLRITTEKSRFYIHEGTVDIKVSGSSWVNFIGSHGLGPVDCLDLESQFTLITSSSPNNCYLQVNQYLDAKIRNAGNIFYRGEPGTIKSESTGSGRLIKID